MFEVVFNVEKIVLIEGVDVFFIGFNDFVFLLFGYVFVRWDELEFLDVLEKVRLVVKKYGKYVGILVWNGVYVKELSEKWKLVGLGFDVRVL